MPKLWDFDQDAEFAYSCARAISHAKESAKAGEEPYLVVRKRVSVSGDDRNFAAMPEGEDVPVAWNIVALYDPDGTEYPS